MDTPTPEQNSEEHIIPKVKTFKEDLANAVKKDNISLVKVALAENKKRERNTEIDAETSPLASKNIFLIGGSLALILIALGIFAFFFFGNKKPTDSGTVTIKPDIIAVESKKGIDVDDFDAPKIFGIAENQQTAQIPLGTIERIYFETGTGTATSILTTEDLFTRLNTRIPSSLLRSFDPNFFFGIHSFNQDNPVLILKTEDYQTAYAGMLSWEKAMYADIGGLFFVPSTTITNATATAPIFQDRVIENKDTRILVDSAGKTLFFYSFVDPNTIVFTNNADTFREVISRLTKPQLVH